VFENKRKKKMRNEIVNYDSADIVKTLKATVAVGLSDVEFKLFCEHCKSTGLNPFKKEVWAIKAGGKLQVMTGIQGYHTIANSHQQYDGLEVGLVGKTGEYYPLTYPQNDYIGAWAKVYRKDRRIAVEGVAMLSEYDKGHGNWKTMRRVMITKCAESIALRKAFPQELNGIYTQEEMPLEFAEAQKPALTEIATLTVADDLPQKEEAVNDKRAEQRYQLEVSFAEKDFAKSFGARWNGAIKKWEYIGDTLPVELEPFYKEPAKTQENGLPEAWSEDDLPDWKDERAEAEINL
jgi:phage recombination protein Bet